MVLFKDEEIPEEPTRLKKWLKRLFMTALVLGCLWLGTVWALSSLSGRNESLKEGLFSFIEQSTGLEVSVENYYYMSIYPNVRVLMEGISLSETPNDVPNVSAGKLAFSMKFRDLLFSKIHVEVFQADNVIFSAGTIAPHEVSFTSFSLADDAWEGGPGFLAKGRYGKEKIDLRLSTDFVTKGKREFHSLGEDNPLRLTLGDMVFDGSLGKGVFSIDIPTYSDPSIADKTMTGNVSVDFSGSNDDIRGKLEFGKSALALDLSIYEKDDGRQLFKGDVQSSYLDVNDVAVLRSFYNKISAYYDQNPASEDASLTIDPELMVDVKLGVDALYLADVLYGGLSAPIKLDSGTLNVGPLKGTLAKGKLDGQLELVSGKMPASMTYKTNLKNWDFSVLRQSLTGEDTDHAEANLDIALKGTGSTQAELLRSLSGHAGLVVGEGKLSSNALNFWGGGLVNSMIPGFNTEEKLALNCVIGDFTVAEGVAKPNALFFDTQRLTVVGEGEIDIAAGQIDLKLEPNAKQPALLDVATAIKITGDISNPSIHPDGMSLLTKLGGLALGIVNPAFLVVSLTDIGLTEDHPCYKYIGSSEEATKKPEDTAPKEISKSSDPKVTTVRKPNE